MKIKLLHERQSRPFRKVEGKSGKVYTFQWDDKAKAYVFETDSQEVSDDFYQSQGTSFASSFAPVYEEPAKQSVNVPNLAAMDLDGQRIVAYTLGLSTLDSDSKATVERLIGAYYHGMDATGMVEFAVQPIASKPSAPAPSPDPTPEPDEGDSNDEARTNAFVHQTLKVDSPESDSDTDEPEITEEEKAIIEEEAEEEQIRDRLRELNVGFHPQTKLPKLRAKLKEAEGR